MKASSPLTPPPPNLQDVFIEFLPWFVAWHLYYWVWYLFLSASMPTFTTPDEKQMRYYSKKLKLPEKMPAAEKTSRVKAYFQNYWIACIVSVKNQNAMPLLSIRGDVLSHRRFVFPPLISFGGSARSRTGSPWEYSSSLSC